MILLVVLNERKDAILFNGVRVEAQSAKRFVHDDEGWIELEKVEGVKFLYLSHCPEYVVRIG